jgi:hypothetical protein
MKNNKKEMAKIGKIKMWKNKENNASNNKRITREYSSKGKKKDSKTLKGKVEQLEKEVGDITFSKLFKDIFYFVGKKKKNYF